MPEATSASLNSVHMWLCSGSETGRITVEIAARYGSTPEVYTAATVEDVSIKVTMTDEDGPRMGSDYKLNITFTNSSSEQRTVIIHGQVAVMYYTGVHKATVSRDRKEVDLLPGAGEASVFNYHNVVCWQEDGLEKDA